MLALLQMMMGWPWTGSEPLISWKRKSVELQHFLALYAWKAGEITISAWRIVERRERYSRVMAGILCFDRFLTQGRINFRIIKPPQPILHIWQGTMFGKFKARCICAHKHYAFQTGYHYITPALNPSQILLVQIYNP